MLRVQSDAFAAVVAPLLLLGAAKLSQFALPKLSRRYADAESDRRRSLDALVAVMAGKIVIVAMCMPKLFRDRTSEMEIMMPRIFMLHSLLYIFDMTYRNCSTSLTIHHLVSIGCGAFAYTTFLRYDENAQYIIRCAMIFYTFATGLADLGADFAILRYYTSEYTNNLILQLRGATYYLVLIRAIQWAFCTYNAVTSTVPWLKIAGFVPCFALWMMEEYKEYCCIKALAGKVSSRMSGPVTPTEKRSFYWEQQQESPIPSPPLSL